MKRKIIIISIISFTILSLLSLYVFLSTRKDDRILFREEGLGSISEVSSLYDKTGIIDNSLPNNINAKAIEIDEYSANELLDAKVGYSFTPIYSYRVVLVRNNELTSTNINSYKDLLTLDEDIRIPLNGKRPGDLIIVGLGAIIGGDDNATETFLNKLNNNGHLVSTYKKDVFDTPFTLTLDYDYYLADNPNLEIIEPTEGIFYINFGILTLDKNFVVKKEELKELAHNNGFSDIDSGSFTYNKDNASNLIVDRVRIYRRDLKKTYFFSGVNSDERSIILLIAIIIFIYWSVSIIYRVNDNTIKKGVLFCVVLLLVWITLRYFKSTVSSPTILRYIWYYNYVPLTVCPALWLLMNIHLFRDGKRSKIISAILFIVPAFLSISVFTNDIHNLAFKFPAGLDNFETRTFNVIFYMICAIQFVFIFAGMILLIIKNSRIASFKRLIWPLFVALLILTYIALDFTSWGFIHELDYNLMITILAFLLMETSLQAGLLQNCGKYKKLFSDLSFDAAISDLDGNYAFFTNGFDTNIKLNEDELLIGDDKYHRFDIKNGYGIFKEDLSEVNKLKENLNYVNLTLERNNEALKVKESYSKEFYKLQTEANLIKELDDELKQRKEEINDLLKGINDDSDIEIIRKNLARIKVLVSYIKQRYNLYLSAKMNPVMEIQNIALSIKLISTDVKTLGINSGLLCNSMEAIPSELGVVILDCFFVLLENAYETKSDLFTNINVFENEIVIFGLFDLNVNIDLHYSEAINKLITEEKIKLDIVQVDDMNKISFKIGSDRNEKHV